MSDPFGNNGDLVDGSDLEQTVDTGVDAALKMGGEFTGRSPETGTIPGPRGDDAPLDRDDVRDTIDDAGLERERFESIEDLKQTRVERERAADEAEAAEQAAYEEHLAEEAERDAAREEAHANGEAFLESEWTTNGETYQEWSLPGGTTITVDSEGNAVSIEYPEGEGPIYLGDVMINGEAHAVYMTPAGTQIVVDDDGNTVGTMDDVDVDDISVPLYHLTGDKNDAGEMVTVELVPNPDGSYDTIVRDAESGEVLDEWDTGTTNVDGTALSNISDAEWNETYSMYAPPGADYYIIIDKNGVAIDTVPIPEEPEWSFLGILEYYEGGEVVVDIGVAEVSVDVVGPDGGISVDLDLLIAEATAGVEWNEDGSWAVDSSLEFDAGGASIMGALGFGQDADGMGFFDVETAMEMQMGIFKLEGGQNFNWQQTPDGFETAFGWEGSFEAFGAFVGREDQVTIVKDGDEYTGTVENTLEAGIRGVGSLSITNETQIVTDLTLGGTSASQGFYGAVNDAQGNEVAGGGVGYDTEEGFYNSDERVDTKADYERVYGDDMPAELGDDAESQAQADADRFGLGAADADEDTADAGGTGRTHAAADGPIGAGVWGGQEGEEFAGRRADDGGTRDVFDDVAGARGARNGGSDEDRGRPEFGSDRPRRGEQDDADHGGENLIGAGQIGGTLGEARDDREIATAGAAGSELIDTPYISEAQVASSPPPPAEEPPAEDPPAEGRPKIFTTRDSDEKPPAGEPADPDPDPDPTPKPTGERPVLFERDPKPTDGTPPDGGPSPTGPKDKPDIFTERLMDTDEDGDGVPAGRDPLDPIGSDDVDLSDIVNGPPARQAASAGPDQSSGTIDHPDDDGLWIDLYTGGVKAPDDAASVGSVFTKDAGTTEVRTGDDESNVDGIMGTTYGGDVADPVGATGRGQRPDRDRRRHDDDTADDSRSDAVTAGDPLADDIVTVPGASDDSVQPIPQASATAYSTTPDTIVLTNESPVEADGGSFSADEPAPEPTPAPEPVVVAADPDPVVVPDLPAPDPVAEVETAIPAVDTAHDGLDDQA
ncbi:MAG: hypothetical protein AAFP84_11640 [Actinomycetota bacterium]